MRMRIHAHTVLLAYASSHVCIFLKDNRKCCWCAGVVIGESTRIQCVVYFWPHVCVCVCAGRQVCYIMQGLLLMIMMMGRGPEGIGRNVYWCGNIL